MDFWFLEWKTIGKVSSSSDECVLEIDGKAYKIDAWMSYDQMFLSIEETTEPHDLHGVWLLSDDDIKKIEDVKEKEWRKQQRERDKQEFERLKKKLWK